MTEHHNKGLTVTALNKKLRALEAHIQQLTNAHEALVKRMNEFAPVRQQGPIIQRNASRPVVTHGGRTR